MTTDTNLREIRASTHAAFRRDGIGHLMAGLSLGLMGLFFFDHRQAWAVFWAIGIWYWIGETLRRRLTYPRLGYAKIPADKRAAVLTGVALLIVLALAALIERSSLAPWGLVYWAIVLTIAAAVLAWTRRSALYGALAVLFLASGPAGRWLIAQGLGEGPACAYQFWVFAAALVTIGLVQLILFLVRNPLLTQDTPEKHS